MKSNFINPTHPGDPVEEGHVHTPLNHSHFEESYDFDMTCRFGDIAPHFVMDGIAGDNIELRSSHALRSFSLESPLLQSISLKKDYFSVPMEAIYPHQWSRIYDNPNIGDDVPDDAYGSVDLHQALVDFLGDYKASIADALVNYDDAVEDEDEEAIKNATLALINQSIQLITGLQYFFSNGSLLNFLGCCLSRRFRSYHLLDSDGIVDGVFSIDRVVDNFWKMCFGTLNDVDLISQLTVYGLRPYTEVVFRPLDSRDSNIEAVSKSRFLELLHDNGFVGNVTSFDGSAARLITFCRVVVKSFSILSFKSIDLSRCFAYQMICAHFYSNDRVDYIYSAELWRQNLLNHYQMIDEAEGSANTWFFTYNGSKLLYDYTSAKYFEYSVSSGADWTKVLKLFAYIFAFRKSLRYVDYFTGAKTSPLAVGDTSVDVSDENNVSVVDITRKIQIQRFLNAVNRMGRKFSNYIKGLFGVEIAPDFHNPLYLGHTGDVIWGRETSNTGDAQMTEANSVTSVLTANASSFAFNFRPDRPCIILGLQYFDIDRRYSSAIERQFFIKDRFDMYNPFLEYIGDQVVYTDELTGGEFVSDYRDTDIYGYTTRYMEYKTRISRAVGGFVEYLPGYAFLADNVVGLAIDPVISPDYIRSHPAEFDEFFISIPGDSLAAYFHFIITTTNHCSANRPMSFAPQIL